MSYTSSSDYERQASRSRTRSPRGDLDSAHHNSSNLHLQPDADTAPAIPDDSPPSSSSKHGHSHHHHHGHNPRVHYALEVDTTTTQPANSNGPPSAAGEVHFSPILVRRRNTRASTFRTIEDLDDLDPRRPGWQPGSEPGYDPEKPDGGHASMPALQAPCEITVVDFSEKRMEMHHFENSGFIEFLKTPQEKWVKCRWINVNGLSWDVIQAIGSNKKLHKLALEDIMNTRNRTKCDWYPNHAFLILTLQKLVTLSASEDSSDGANSLRSGKDGHGIKGRLSRLFRRAESSSSDNAHLRNNMERGDNVSDAEHDGLRKHRSAHSSHLLTIPEGFSESPSGQVYRSLQKYHASPNDARTEFMEGHAALAARELAVSAEQVAIFLTSDNTAISFFELSADDIEVPILTRLSNPGTILRESCDASLMVQAIIDAVIDLAIPLTTVYSEVIGDLELEVLVSPSVKQSQRLYIVMSEINKMLSFLLPIDNLVNVLRDHKTPLPQDQAVKILLDPASGVMVTPMTHTYLGDVLDHCVIIVEAMHQMNKSADNLISLIFNTISATQNETMKQLTAATIFFLPLTFLTGYFGMNFEPFYELDRGTPFFWELVVPTVFVTVVVLQHRMIWSWISTMVTRRRIVSLRKTNALKRAKLKRK